MKRAIALLTILTVALPVYAAAGPANDYVEVDRTKGFPFLSGETLKR